MNTPNDGGPAFPLPAEYDGQDGTFRSHGNVGMSLRDYFAGQYIQGACLLTDEAIGALFQRRRDDEDDTVDDVLARDAYALADAMLRAWCAEAEA